jgi:hypothetical protein
LDGVRHRVTRRRRLQRGGGAPVDSYASWLKAVNEDNGLYKEHKDTERENYSISLIKADSDKHMLPMFNGEDMEKFAMPNGDDVRSTAANIAAMLKLIMDANPTIGQFKQEITVQQQPGIDALASADVMAQLQMLAETEQVIRSSGNNAEAALTKQSDAQLDILTDVSKYPLYIWALYYSAPDGENSVPILTPHKKVLTETGSSDSTTPAGPGGRVL